MKTIKGVAPQCKCRGKRIKKGDVVEVEEVDARYLVSRGLCEYVGKAPPPPKGLTAKDSGLKGKKAK